MSSNFQIKKFRILISILFIILLMTFLMPNEGKFRYEYQKGRPWIYETLIAPVDFPILKSGAELREERNKISSSTIPHYRKKPSEDFLQNVKSVVNAELPDSTSDFVFKFIDDTYKAGIMDESPDSAYTGGVIAVVSDDGISYLPMGELKNRVEAYEAFETFVKTHHFDTLKNNQSISLLQRIFPSGVVTPNLFYDNSSTQASLKNSLSDVSPTKGIIYSGQLIVSNGEIITAETEQILDSFKAEFEMSMGFSGNILLLKTGHLLITAFIVLLFAATLWFLSKDMFNDPNSFNFLLLLFILVVLSTLFVMDTSSRYLYIVPYSVIALYLYSFFSSSVVIPLYAIIMLPIVFLSQGGFEIYFANLTAGSAAFFTFRYWDRGWLQFINSVFVFCALSLVYISFRLIEEGALSIPDGNLFIYFAWNSLLVIAAYPFLFLFEKLFGLVSNSRLRDLSDATTPLLTQLAEEAPGTFHHSLQVANLSESAAREIGANVLLTRVGALYHDIGKLSNPSFFIENIPAGEVSAHKDLSTEQSAAIILSHVEDGMALAHKMRLPSAVSEFISTHHGKSQALYFFNKFVNEGGNPDEIGKFTYNGNLPTTKEHVVVMLADSVEAASRTLKQFSANHISELVDKMIEERLESNQLVESQITMKEINIIKETFKRKLLQSHHGRITYPSRKR